MKLLYQTHSPFARKVLVFAYEAGLADQIEVIHHETSPTNKNNIVFAQNPLGKVPVLINDSEPAIFDSSVICAYLDRQHDMPNLIPNHEDDYIQTMRLQALADGLSDAGIWARWEAVRRPEHLRFKALQNGMELKLLEGYSFIEREVDLDDRITLGKIALATSLSWLEFRELPDFRKGHPKLTKWFDRFSERKSMVKTTLVGDTWD